MVDYTGKTVVASTVFIDIVGYTRLMIEQQIAIKTQLNRIIADAIGRIAESERVIVDTGDGAALCFLGDPEDALFVATAVTDATRKQGGETAPRLRTGIHLGPIKVVVDLNGHPNVLGDGINFAQRVMSFAEEHEILVSRPYYEVISRLNVGNEKLFQYVGVKHDKHIQEHQIYAVSPQPLGAAENVAPGPAHESQSPSTTEASAVLNDATPLRSLTEAVLAGEAQRLADRVGPVAQVVVERAAGSSASVGDFYRTIAAVIPDDADRDAFLAKALVAGAPEAPRPIADPPRSAPAPQSAPGTVPEAVPSFSADDLETATKQLAEHIGPLAKVLVKKEAARARDIRALYEQLAAYLDDEGHRAQFLATTPKGL